MELFDYLLGKKAGGGTPTPPVLQEKSITITENTTTDVLPDSEYDGLSKVEIETNVQTGADLSEYFDETYTITNPSTIYCAGWINQIIKMPKITTQYTKWLYRGFRGNEIDLSGISTNITTLEGTFQDCVNLTSLDLSNLNTSNVTNMSQMFSGCNALTSLNLTNLNTSNVTNMSFMFSTCRSLTTINLPNNFNIENVTTIAGMFSTCLVLANIDLTKLGASKSSSFNNMFANCSAITNFNLSNLQTTATQGIISSMFENCRNATIIDLSKLNVKVTSSGNMFKYCTSLTKIDIRGLDLTTITYSQDMFGNPATNSAVPDNCLIIVADQTQKDWVNTNFPRLTNVQTVAEYEANLNR